MLVHDDQAVADPEQERARWLKHIGATQDNPEVQLLAERAVWLTAKLRRHMRDEEANLKERRRHAVEAFDNAQSHQVYELVERIGPDAPLVAPRLEQSPAGIDWMIAHWQFLLDRLRAHGHWTFNELVRVACYLGLSPKPFRQEQKIYQLMACHLAAGGPCRSDPTAPALALASADPFWINPTRPDGTPHAPEFLARFEAELVKMGLKPPPQPPAQEPDGAAARRNLETLVQNQIEWLEAQRAARAEHDRRGPGRGARTRPDRHQPGRPASAALRDGRRQRAAPYPAAHRRGTQGRDVMSFGGLSAGSKKLSGKPRRGGIE